MNVKCSSVDSSEINNEWVFVKKEGTHTTIRSPSGTEAVFNCSEGGDLLAAWIVDKGTEIDLTSPMKATYLVHDALADAQLSLGSNVKTKKDKNAITVTNTTVSMYPQQYLQAAFYPKEDGRTVTYPTFCVTTPDQVYHHDEIMFYINFVYTTDKSLKTLSFDPGLAPPGPDRIQSFAFNSGYFIYPNTMDETTYGLIYFAGCENPGGCNCQDQSAESLASFSFDLIPDENGDGRGFFLCGKAN